jgi:transcriptional regulator with XRE-family HTH domain
MITGGQIRAARKLLSWSQEALAGHAGVSDAAIGSFERGPWVPSDRIVRRIREALESAGVEFANGGEPPVKLKESRQACRATAKDLGKRNRDADKPCGRFCLTIRKEIRRILVLLQAPSRNTASRPRPSGEFGGADFVRRLYQRRGVGRRVGVSFKPEIHHATPPAAGP